MTIDGKSKTTRKKGVTTMHLDSEDDLTSELDKLEISDTYVKVVRYDD